MQSTSNPIPSEESVRFRAYLLWEADGRQHGRDDHYWCEAIAQIQGERTAPLGHSPATVRKAPRARKVPNEDSGVAVKKAKKAKATLEGKTGAAEAGNEVKAKGDKKASTKEAGKQAEKSAIVGEPKSAKKTKKAEGAAKAPETGPARAKKPRKALPAEGESPSQ
ncbi:DUF2934 domain-containing protein [Caballeronia novacaledonica]|uniref:DUF2934 domain-containing protein n=1 Tax=Caballeronia novacaledonica TaxID=1544861 RepID=A0AA37IBM3_9BURK|nr:DUF2934 domain-containing protein [Caballeronia novacaledonica]GJH26961.1 DUF2934 domain-containing protein [Caballeronia novacaledonica]